MYPTRLLSGAPNKCAFVSSAYEDQKQSVMTAGGESWGGGAADEGINPEAAAFNTLS